MLPDIAFCSNKECKKSETCRRHSSNYNWNGECVTFCDFKDLPDKPCEDYWPWNFANIKPIEVDNTGANFYEACNEEFNEFLKNHKDELNKIREIPPVWTREDDADYDDWGDVEEVVDDEISGKLISAEELIKELQELATKTKNLDTRNGLCAAVAKVYELDDKSKN